VAPEGAGVTQKREAAIQKGRSQKGDQRQQLRRQPAEHSPDFQLASHFWSTAIMIMMMMMMM